MFTLWGLPVTAATGTATTSASRLNSHNTTLHEIDTLCRHRQQWLHDAMSYTAVYLQRSGGGRQDNQVHEPGAF